MTETAAPCCANCCFHHARRCKIDSPDRSLFFGWAVWPIVGSDDWCAEWKPIKLPELSEDDEQDTTGQAFGWHSVSTE